MWVDFENLVSNLPDRKWEILFTKAKFEKKHGYCEYGEDINLTGKMEGGHEIKLVHRWHVAMFATNDIVRDEKF